MCCMYPQTGGITLSQIKTSELNLELNVELKFRNILNEIRYIFEISFSGSSDRNYDSLL